MSEVRARTSLDLLSVPLGTELSNPDDVTAAQRLNMRLQLWAEVDRLQSVSFVERGLIVLQFERKMLWRHLDNPATGERFQSFPEWMASGVLGCRSVNYESWRDMQELRDVPPDKLLTVPKSNIKILKQLSGSVRKQDDVLEAARTMPPDEFLGKLQVEQPEQHLETREPMRFMPTTSQREVIEAAIAKAMDDGASSRTEALEFLAINYSVESVVPA